MRKFLLVCVTCMFLSEGFTQTARVLNLKDGLSNNYVQCILQDQAGYIWVGTRDGLNRYNGHEVEIYKDELQSTFIYSLRQDTRGRIWIGTSRGGISLYYPEEERFETLKIKGKPYTFLADKDVYSIYEDAEHDVWLGTLQGLARINQKMDTVIWYQQHSTAFSHSFTAIYEDRQKRLWLGTNKGLFWLKDKNNGQRYPDEYLAISALHGLFIRDIKEDAQGHLWIATDERGIFNIDPKTGTFFNYSSQSQSGLKSNPVWKILIDRRGAIWAGMINGGIYQFDPRRNVFVSRQQKVASVFNSQSITDVLEDFNGNIWITSHGDGVCYFNPGKYVFEKYLSGKNTNGGDRADIVSAFAEDQNKNIWIGTDGDGLKKLSSTHRTIQSFAQQNRLSSNIILDILPDQNDGLWLATWQGGVDFYSGKTNRVEVFNEQNKNPFGIKTPNVKSILRDRSGNIWMVTHGKGLAIYDPRRKKFIDPQTIHAAFNPEVAQWGSDILQAANGDIWIASHAGLFRYHGDGLDQYYPTTSPTGSLASSLVYCLFEDSKHNVWVGTNTSLERYISKENRFENCSKAYNIPGNIKCILEDDQHHLWLSTIDRIVEFDPESKQVRTFDQGYNIQEGQFYECACLKSSEGKFYFGGTEGFNAFYPDSVHDDQLSSRVLITDLYLFNKKQKPGAEESVLCRSIPFTKTIDLTYDQNVISIEFLALDYSSYRQNTYSYRMEGFDKTWSPPSSSRMATYTNLDPGPYTFKVRSISSDSKVLSESSIAIRVVPPFWRTTWFKVLASFALVFSLVTFFALRLLSSRRKRIVLQQLVATRTKEVSEKNVLLEKQTEDLRHQNETLLAQETKIRDQAHTLEIQKDQLQINNSSLEDLNATKDRLFSIIAHDLRNPFTSLLGFSRLLYMDFDRYSDEEKQKLIRGMYKSSSGIYSLLENLLVWSKAQQNFLVFSPEKIFFRKLVQEQLDFIREDAEKKHVSLLIDAGDEISFFADRNMLNIVLRNLLSNALKYSPINGRIDIGYHIQQHGLEVVVRDQGIGLEEGAKLFEINTESHRDHNHGLGLILCREFIEKHGGTIKAGNNKVGGAFFSFMLPACNPALEQRVDDPMSDAERIESISSNGKSEIMLDLPVVLIAEDDDQVRWYIKQILFPEFQVIESVNGEDGRKLTLEKNPDVIISDLVMPKLDGLAFCQFIKSQEATSHIPFIMLTAERSDEKKVHGFQFGADDYVTKPIEPNVLRARLHNLIETRRKLKSIYQRDITATPEAFTTNGLDQAFLERLNGIIESQIANPELNPDHLSREMNMSRTGLYTKVKALTGESVGIYIRNVRLKESKKLLRTRQYNISEVAYAVGFNQLPYFTTCFREAFGITPSEFVAGKNSAQAG